MGSDGFRYLSSDLTLLGLRLLARPGGAAFVRPSIVMGRAAVVVLA